MKAKKKLTWLWGFPLVLVMLVGLLSTTALAADPATKKADFISDPTAALALLNAAKTPGAEDSTWDADTKTLTLNGVNFTTTAATAVKLPDGAIIVLNGENIIKGGSGSGDCYGIYGEGSLTIQGTGTLNVTSGEANRWSFGIRAETGVTIKGDAVEATGGKAGEQSFGIYTLGGDLTIEGGIVTANGGDATVSSNGLWAGNGSVTISGGKVVANGGGASSGTSSGIYANKVVIKNTGSRIPHVTTRGGNGVRSYGIFVYGSGKSVTISGGAVIAKAGSATSSAAALNKAPTLPTTPYWWRTSDSGDYFKSSNTAYTGDGSEAHLEIWNLDPTATADFTSGDGTAALALLNAAKTGAADSTWDPDTKTLTLNGVNFTATAATAVKLPDGATIVLADGTTNTIKGGDSATGECYGIQGARSLTIDGAGTLTVTGGESTAPSGYGHDYSHGIYVNGNVTIEGGNVNANGGAAGTSFGIWANGGDVAINSGTVTAKSGDGTYSYGIDAGKNVTISGGTVTATGGNGTYSYGIAAGKNVTISGGTVKAKAGSVDGGGTAAALNKAPTLTITAYSWRTSDSNDYSECPGSAYTYVTGQTYVEIKSNPTISITSVAITGIDAPVSNKALDTTAACAPTGVSTTTVTWNPDDDEKAGYGATYTASVTLTAAAGYAFADGTTATVNGNPATSVTKNANETLTVTYTFPATDKHNIEITVDTDVRGGDAAKNPTISSGYEIEYCFFVEDTDKDGVFINKTGNNITLDDKTMVVDKALVEAFAAQSGGRFTYESLMGAIKDEFHLDELKTEFTGGYDYSVLAYICHSDNAYFAYDDNQIVTNAIVKVNGKKITDNCLGYGGGMEIIPVAYVFSAATGSTPTTPTYTPPTYKVESTVSEDADGSVSVSKASAKKGDTVTITVTPDRYYKTSGVIVKDASGNQIAVTDNGNGTFTFQMPDSKVTVEPVFSWDNPFVDVAGDAYYAPAVEWALKNEVTGGTSDTTFSPDAGCTRAQIVTFLWRAAGSPEPKSMNSFSDVSADAYYAKAVAWAVEQGITGGTGNGKFSPDAVCTRGQIVTFLWRAEKSPAVGTANPFTDVEADAYYAGATNWAVENGITEGTGDGTTFSPANDCTRAQIVAFLYRYFVK